MKPTFYIWAICLSLGFALQAKDSGVSKEPLIGDWHWEAGPVEVGGKITLKKDGSFTEVIEDRTFKSKTEFAGKWALQGNTLTLTLDKKLVEAGAKPQKMEFAIQGIEKKGQRLILSMKDGRNWSRWIAN